MIIKKQQWGPILELTLAMLLLCLCSGCRTLLPSGIEQDTTHWRSYEQIEDTFSLIEANSTTLEDLSALGIDFKTTPNITKLTYLDVMERFKLDSTIFSGVKLPPGVEAALNNHDKCFAYEIVIGTTRRARVGSFWKDVLGFEQITKTTGWAFKALVVIDGNIVMYVLHSGQPKIERTLRNKKPLGPLQSLDGGTLIDAVNNL